MLLAALVDLARQLCGSAGARAQRAVRHTVQGHSASRWPGGQAGHWPRVAGDGQEER